MRGTTPRSDALLRPHRARQLVVRCLVPLLALALLCSCGGGDGDGNRGLGTVSLVNQTHLGQAPLVVEQFFLAPVGEVQPGDNLLNQAVQPGALVIVGLFPAGSYNAVAVLDGGGQINFPVAEVRPGEPTDFVVPGP